MLPGQRFEFDGRGRLPSFGSSCEAFFRLSEVAVAALGEFIGDAAHVLEEQIRSTRCDEPRAFPQHIIARVPISGIVRLQREDHLTRRISRQLDAELLPRDQGTDRDQPRLDLRLQADLPDRVELEQ